MTGFLFDKVVFGPVQSRRLGVSLGINLLPTSYKHCYFNCIYCECGWTKNNDIKNILFPPAITVKQFLKKKLLKLQKINDLPDSISFAGNGEPTMHPDFSEIIDFTIELRNKYSPKSKVTVLSNATMIYLPEIVSALKKVDMNILKLDAGTEKTFLNINNPALNISLKDIVTNLKQFPSNLILQTLFVRGEYNGKMIDNTSEKEISAWLNLIKEIRPERLMIYPIARATPVKSLEKISLIELELIAEKVKKLGIIVDVYY